MKPRINRASADIGGTFTDIVIEIDGIRASTKVLTTHQAPERAVIEGVFGLLQKQRLGLADIDIFLHGTTLATNAIIERRGARTALITTRGFRDTIEIGSESRHDQYDIFIKKPQPLVGRGLRYTVAERVAADGSTLLALDENEVEALAEKLEQAQVESIAVSLINAYANSSHEQRVREILSARLPRTYFSLSSETCPEIREYERTSTTVANAYIRPIMAGYLGRLKSELSEKGMKAPILLMTSGGGLTTVEQAADYPIRLVESGPAGGAILAAKIAQECALDKIISFDMGGTTAKICLIDHGEPLKSRSFEVDRTERFLKGSGLPVRIPVIEMVEIGAGGGSIAQVDSLGRLTVGPESASSEPGPACYGLGGRHATVTDGDFVLGRIDTRKFADGRMTLRRDLAEKALATHVGGALSLGPVEAAAAVTAIVEENMSNASRVHAAEHGKDLRQRAMVAFGGAAPMHAAQLARKLSLVSVVIPKGAGVGSAIGFLEAPMAYEVVRSRHSRLDAVNDVAITELLASMQLEAKAVVFPAARGLPIDMRVSAFLRYVGQGHELEVGIPVVSNGRIDARELKDAFDQRYSEVFGRFLPNHEIEVLTWAVTASATQPVPVADLAPIGTRESVSPSGTTNFTDMDGMTADAPIYERTELAPGVLLTGPLVVTERETNTVVPTGFTVECNSFGHLVLTNLAAQAALSA
ncbi:hydantoinase/oxoprolinase family protein [Phyllobacterium endophyticum]|uniref:Methylhydantoinase n=1 Tax=Phyllobacterium endophyticum TaxID=1149773 RepID=A0A2P7AS44_9HYPH|nr:hydantoinase/oxoprolinase family protein [Phyllobacterium endophyticum]MBB3236765.1 N-methylhydantoinase A [Phyllobacterium endophyticum]PSH57041.1 methylhydantoinase [Phyllobacterium endophyticum]TYR40320.1 hydantoinase/oxoprolinase family protein [Phyllobacterium endophyticum]